jgi:hypothetical protein
MFDRMQVALFRSEKDPDVFAFTTDRTGANLPSDFAPWSQTPIQRATRAGLQKSGNGTRLGSAVAQALQRDGICLACTRSTFTRLGHDWNVIQ